MVLVLGSLGKGGEGWICKLGVHFGVCYEFELWFCSDSLQGFLGDPLGPSKVFAWTSTFGPVLPHQEDDIPAVGPKHVVFVFFNVCKRMDLQAIL